MRSKTSALLTVVLEAKSRSLSVGLGKRFGMPMPETAGIALHGNETSSLTTTKGQTMLPMKALRFARTLRILVALVPLCGWQLYAQGLDPGTPLGAAARARAAVAARRLPERAVGSPMATPT